MRAAAVVLLVIGVISAAAGVVLLAASIVPESRTTSFTLQPGAYYHTRLPINVLSGGTVTVTFQASPGSVDQFVMTAAQYAVWASGGTTSTLASDSGSNGTFSASLPSGGTYYIISAHSTGYADTFQSGIHTTTVSAVAPSPFIGSVVAFVVGFVLIGIGLWLRRKPARTAPRSYTPYGLGAAVPPPGAWLPSQVPPSGAPSGGGPAGYGTVVVTIENPSPEDQTVQLLVNGVLVTSLAVAGGKSAQAVIHPALPYPYGSSVRVEAVAANGRRASQDVTATAQAATPVAFRLG